MKNKLCVYSAPVAGANTHKQKIDAAVHFGMGGVEFLNCYEFDTPSIQNAREIKAYAEGKNLAMPCFSVCCDFRGNKNETIERLRGYANVAKELGCEYLHHTIISECADPGKVLPDKLENYKLGLYCVREVYDYAASIGIKTVYEDQGYIFNGIEGFGNFLADVNRDVGVVADFGNIYEADCTITDFLKAFKDKLCHVHVKDMLVTDLPQEGGLMRTLSGKFVREVLPGTGSVDIKCGMKLLCEMNYDGFISTEFTVRTGNAEEDAAKYSELLKLFDMNTEKKESTKR